MSFDREEFRATLAKKAQERQNGMLPVYRMVQAAGVVMGRLMTGSGDWNRYLQILQGQIERTEAAKVLAQTKMADPSIWDARELNKLKSDLIQADAMIAAWRLAMELPTAIIAGSEYAQELIGAFEKEHGHPVSETAQP